MNTPLNWRVLAKRTAIIAVGATAINVALGVIGKMISQPPETFGPYMNSSVAGLTVIGVVGAAVVYALMRHLWKDAAQANTWFFWLSFVLLLLSFYPDVALPWSTDPDEVGWTYGIMANLMFMHVVAAVPVMYWFTKAE